ncbi:MAG: tetratricopeptide repeat protein [Planctomycetota bacterium]
MSTYGKRAFLFCGVGFYLIGCAPKEYAGFQPDRANWLKADTEAAHLAVEADDPPIRPRTHFAAGQLFEQQGDLHKAIAQYRKAVVATPDYVPAYNRLGVLLGRLGRHPEAEQALRKAVELRPDWALLRNNLGFEYMLQERWPDAEAELRNALRLKPDFPRAHNNLAMVLFRVGRLEESLREFQQAVPEADAYYNLGLMFRAQHRYEEAASTFEHALALAPQFQAAKVQLADLAPRLEQAAADEPVMNQPDAQRVADASAAGTRPEAEVLVAEAATPEEPCIELVVEEGNIAFAEVIPEFEFVEEEPCEPEPAADSEDDPLESEASQSLLESTLPISLLESQPLLWVASVADPGGETWLDRQVYLFPDHPLAGRAPADSNARPQGPPASAGLREFREVFDENDPGPMPPFDD